MASLFTILQFILIAIATAVIEYFNTASTSKA